MITLEEAITHAEEVAEANENVVNTGKVDDNVTVAELYCDDTECIDAHIARCKECAEDHRQLAEWLTDYQSIMIMLAEMKHEIAILESPFGPTGEWYDGKEDVVRVIEKYFGEVN